MRKVLLVCTLFILASCSSPLSKKFNPDNFGADFSEIQKKVGKDDADMLKSYILSHSIVGRDIEINGLTYQQILDKAKAEKKEKEEAIATFNNKRFTNLDNFLDDLQAIVDKKCIAITNEEVGCLGAFCGWKEKEGVIKNYTYKKIMDEAPGFCSENGF